VEISSVALPPAVESGAATDLAQGGGAPGAPEHREPFQLTRFSMYGLGSNPRVFAVLKTGPLEFFYFPPVAAVGRELLMAER